MNFRMARPLKLLLVEDDASDAELLVVLLGAEGYALDCVCVDNERDFLRGLQDNPDLIISDYHMPGFNGQRALILRNMHKPDIPFIMVSGTIGEEIAVEIMKMGAADYLMKDRLARLGLAIQHTLEQRRTRAQREDAVRDLARAQDEAKWKNALLEAQLDSTIDAILVVDQNLVHLALSGPR